MEQDKVRKELMTRFDETKNKVLSFIILMVALILYSMLFRLEGNWKVIGLVGIFIIAYFWNTERIK